VFPFLFYTDALSISLVSLKEEGERNREESYTRLCLQQWPPKPREDKNLPEKIIKVIHDILLQDSIHGHPERKSYAILHCALSAYIACLV